MTQLLKRKIGNLIKDYHTAFSPDKVGQGALGTAIVILSFLSTHNSEKLCNMLVKYVKVCQYGVQFTTFFSELLTNAYIVCCRENIQDVQGASNRRVN